MTGAPEADLRDLQALRGLIAFAEEADARLWRLFRQRALVTGVIAVGALALAAEAWLTLRPSPPKIDTLTWADLAAGAAGLAVGIVLGVAVAALVYGRALRREQRAFQEVTELIHEVFATLSPRLSPLEQADLRIRLSRLNL